MLFDLFHRHFNLEDLVFHAEARHTGFNVGLHTLLIAGVGVQHIPFALEGAQAVGEVFDGLGAGILLVVFLALFGLVGNDFGSRLCLNGLIGGFLNAFAFGRQRLNGGHGLEISFRSLVEVVGKHFVSHAVSPSSC